MQSSHPLRALLTVDDDSVRLRCRDILTAGGYELIDADDVSTAEPIDLIVTDRPASDNLLSAAPAGQGVPAVLHVGNAPAAGSDATLPADFSARELSLACQLLAEIVALRRSQQNLVLSQETSARLADTDPLTALANRRAWDRRLAAVVELTTPAERLCCLALLDLDRFKSVNDQGGMSAGDEALRQVATALRTQVRRDDLLARLGGDEFGVLLSVANEADAAHVLERLRAAIEGLSAEHRLGISASIGYTICGDGVTAAATGFTAAEQALQAAKHAGGNRVCRG